MKERLPINDKVCLTLEEASELTNVGRNRLRELSDEDDCEFVLFVGNKRLLKKDKLINFLNNSYSI